MCFTDECLYSHISPIFFDFCWLKSNYLDFLMIPGTCSCYVHQNTPITGWLERNVVTLEMTLLYSIHAWEIWVGGCILSFFTNLQQERESWRTKPQKLKRNGEISFLGICLYFGNSFFGSIEFTPTSYQNTHTLPRTSKNSVNAHSEGQILPLCWQAEFHYKLICFDFADFILIRGN